MGSLADPALAVYFLFPETNGRHLEEVDQIFRDSKNIFDPPRMANKLPVGVFADVEMPAEKMQGEAVETVSDE